MELKSGPWKEGLNSGIRGTIFAIAMVRKSRDLRESVILNRGKCLSAPGIMANVNSTREKYKTLQVYIIFMFYKITRGELTIISYYPQLNNCSCHHKLSLKRRFHPKPPKQWEPITGGSFSIVFSWTSRDLNVTRHVRSDNHEEPCINRAQRQWCC